jgi:4-amino-4-deoxy-L-arabinose transferase-like glycosyltransferase
MFYLFPFRERFEFDPDEGINAMVSLLVARGYAMFAEIWSDHPPLLPHLLAVWLRLFGSSIQTARILTLLFSTILLGAAYKILSDTWGIACALAGALLIFLLPFYNTLSVAVMIGLPAIALAMVALLALLNWHLRKADIWLVLSAIALAFSILTKLFTGFLAPIFLIGILIDQKYDQPKIESWAKLLRPAIIWALMFTGILLGIGLLLIKPENLPQFFGNHLAARQVEHYLNLPKSYTLLGYLRESWLIFLLALVGGILAISKRKWLSLYLIAWTAIGYLLLNFQVPVWYHHQLLITIPAAMLAGVAIGEAVHSISSIYHSRRILSLQGLLIMVILIVFGLALITRVPTTISEFSQPDMLLERERLFLTRMSNHAPETHWVVTDMPMYAYRIGASVPPPVVALSEKRLITGELTEDQIVDVVQEYRPEQVLIGRFEFPKLKAYLEQDYKLLYRRGKRALYLRLQ